MPADIEFNIEQMLQSERAWEFVLLDIVQSEDLNPWDIDITKLTAKYTERVNKMKHLDLRIPARLILAAAILLKMKSDRLLFEDGAAGLAGEEFGEGFEDEDLFNQPDAERKVMEDVPDLTLNVRRKHIRKITLADLIDKLRRSIDPALPRGVRKKFRLDLPEENITQKLEALYGQIIAHSLKRLPFSKLIEKKNRRGIIETFIPLLHLASEYKVDLNQDGFFSEIFVEQVPEDERQRRLTLTADEKPEEKNTMIEEQKQKSARKRGKKKVEAPAALALLMLLIFCF